MPQKNKTVRVNIRSVANVDGVRKEKRNGRDLTIVPSATLPDNVVMNGIMYPADEIANSFMSLERTPAPAGHPVVNGKFISAKDPEGINIGYIGAWNENVRQSGGRVFLDKVIDEEVANRTQGGKDVLNAIEKKQPIHTSTGLICELEPAAEDQGHKFVARNMRFDHDAILLNEEGAATPDQGVGMLVNGNEIEVLTCSLESAMRELDWAAESAVRAKEQLDNQPLFDRIKSAILGAFAAAERGTQANGEENSMPITDKQFEDLSAKVNTLAESFGKLDETIATAVANGIKPLTDNLEELKANQEAKDKAELEGLVKTIVKANVLDETAAKELTLTAARALAEKAKPKKAAPVGTGAFNAEADGDGDWAGYSLNAVIDGKEEKAA